MPYYYGDYYPLTKTTRDNAVWIAWQFDRPERGDGVVQVFRRRDSIAESARLKLRGLDPKAKYQITRLDREDQSGQLAISGEELLQNGISVSVVERPGAVIVKYRQVP